MDALDCKLLDEMHHSFIQGQLTVKLIKEFFERKSARQASQLEVQQNHIKLLNSELLEQKQANVMLKRQLEDIKEKTIEKPKTKKAKKTQKSK